MIKPLFKCQAEIAVQTPKWARDTKAKIIYRFSQGAKSEAPLINLQFKSTGCITG